MHATWNTFYVETIGKKKKLKETKNFQKIKKNIES
jgi:hypothetical protein